MPQVHGGSPGGPAAGRAGTAASARGTGVARVRPVAIGLPGGPGAPVIPEGVTHGGLDLPTAVSTVGWWSAGAALTDRTGSIVLAGHVDSADQGLGYFARLRDVVPGQRVDVRGSDRRVHAFVVTGRRTYPKARGLPGSVFDPAVSLRLVLITCTGHFDRARHSYDDNLVVYAVPTR